MAHPVQTDDTAHLSTAAGALRLQVRVADNFLSRFRGLMFSAPLTDGAGLLLLDCTSVHCAFMRQTIDVLYLDHAGVVLKCVPGLRPWRASVGNAGRDAHGRPLRGVCHTLELGAGSIARAGVRPGDRLVHRALPPPAPVSAHAAPVPRGRRQRGVSLVEFAVVGPILTLIGLSLVQYGMLFFAKSQINHASFLAARAGSTGHASLDAVRKSYGMALAPMYGGGKSVAELAQAQAAAAADVAAFTRIELLNPTRESFDDWNDPALQARLNESRRVIPNAHQDLPRDALGNHRAQTEAGATSGQTIGDANLLKLRVTHGYAMSVPVVASVVRSYLGWMDPKTDAFHTRLIEQGRLPVVTSVTLEMQSDAIEGETISVPGKGNGGQPQDPGPTQPGQGQPPVCDQNLHCNDPTVPGGGGDGPGGGTDPGEGGYCPVPVKTELKTDTLFEFGKADLLPEGKQALNQLIEAAKNQPIKSAEIAGYTDQIGDADVNERLSQQRAQAVKDYLLANGFPNVPMTVVGKGESDPVVGEASCVGQDAKACLAPNRRVVVTLQR